MRREAAHTPEIETAASRTIPKKQKVILYPLNWQEFVGLCATAVVDAHLIIPTL